MADDKRTQPQGPLAKIYKDYNDYILFGAHLAFRILILLIAIGILLVMQHG